MRKLERDAAIGAYDRMKPGDRSDEESFKTRKGKVGGYREYLTADEIDAIDARIAANLSPFFADYARAPAAQPRSS